MCNTVCDVLQGRTIDIQFCQLFLKPSKEKIDFLLEVRNYLKLEGEMVFSEISPSPYNWIIIASNAQISEAEKNTL